MAGGSSAGKVIPSAAAFDGGLGVQPGSPFFYWKGLQMGDLDVKDDVDLDLDEDLEEEDLDEGLDDDNPQPDAGVRQIATSLGVDPSKYDNADDLRDAIDLRIGAMNRGELTSAEKKQVEFATLKFEADDPDRVLGSELKDGLGNLAKGINENFAKVADALKGKSGTTPDPKLASTLKELRGAIANLNDRGITLTMDAWLARRSEAIREYFGTESMGELDPTGIHAKRRNALRTRAGKAADSETKAGRNYTIERMLAKGMKGMKHFQKSKSSASRSRERAPTDDGEGTALARGSGTSGKDYGSDDSGAAALKRRAADVVGKHLRNSG